MPFVAFDQLPQIGMQIFYRRVLIDIKTRDFGIKERFSEKDIILESLGNLMIGN